jgi:NAD(P)-dependent dehydrogenase (short-subunit alcohol dehydrogenase family)
MNLHVYPFMSTNPCEVQMTDSADTPAVLVTGAAGGIGTAITQALAGRGYLVYAGMHHDTEQHAVTPGVRPVPLDVTSAPSVQAAADEIADRQDGRGLRAVVNNAGIIVSGPVELIPGPEMERQFAVNVLGPAHVTKAFAPLLRTAGGRLINISAPTARLAVPYAGAISASKAALESLSAAARVELAPWGIAVVIVVPGAIDTEIFAKADAAARGALRTADPQRVALYRRQLSAVATAQSSMRTSPPRTVADAVLRAIEAPRPRARYAVNADARIAGILSRLPTRARDRVLARALGLHKAAAGSA